MNPELMERFLAKKAKKLGITVEELKARNNANSTSHTEITEDIQSVSVTPESASTDTAQTTNTNETENNSSYTPLQPQPEKVEVPSYIFGPVKMSDQPTKESLQSSTPLTPQITPQPKSPIPNQPATYHSAPHNVTRPSFQAAQQPYSTQHVEIKDNRENKFALIGYPLGHSLSKVIHEAGFKSLGINATYDILETPPDTLVDRIKFLKANCYKGFNVTIPLKLPISLFVNEVDNYADLARAVNTVYIDADKSLKAYNTDVAGFKRAIPKDFNLVGQKVAILGTGGAAHAVCVALTECKVKEIAFFTRNIPNSIELMNYVRRKFPSIDFNVYQIENIRSLEEYAMLVNTTPIGMLGKAGDLSPVEFRTLQTLKQNALVYDVIYNPKKTILIKDAQKLGLRTVSGLDMLIFQAVMAQKIWFNGLEPDWKDMKIAALEAL